MYSAVKTPKPQEYELFVKTFYERLLSETDGPDLTLHHRKKFRGLSGQNYEFDLAYERLLGGEIRILVLFECKAYSKKVKINDILEFSEKVKDIHAHKGILVTTKGYERGAYVVAKANQIGLAVLRDEAWLGEALATSEDKIPPIPFYMNWLMDISVGHRWHAQVRTELYRDLAEQEVTSDIVRVGRLGSYMEEAVPNEISLLKILWDVICFILPSFFVSLRFSQFSQNQLRKLVGTTPYVVLVDEAVAFSINGLLEAIVLSGNKSIAPNTTTSCD